MPLLLLTPDCGRVIDANERFLRFSGQRLSGLVGRPLEDTGVVAETREWRGLLLRLEGGRSVRDEPFAWFAGGARHETRLSAELLDIGGTPSVLVSFEDVTERRDLEHRLRQVQKMEAVGQLAAGVAHDFNNLLTVVEGYAGLLLGRADVAPDVRQDVRRIMQAAESASALTRKLLAFSRRQVVQPRPVRVNDHVLAMQDMLTRLIGERVEVRFEIGPGLPVVLGDPNGLEQVVLNLALNARDAMPDGGVVQIGTAMVEIPGTHAGGHPLARPGRFALLTVCDDGVGMDEATLARIFEPFFTTKEAGKGTGLGLASVYAIVQQHRGWIEVSSRPGQGTRFVVYLPLSEAGPEPSEARRPARETRGDATVLVVEDEETVRSLVRLVLGRAGYRVIEAANATAALEAWGTHARAIDLVLTDMIMPGAMTGIGLAAELRRHRPRLPVLFSSGYSPEIAGSEMVTEAVFLPKPYTPEMLLDKVAACLVPGPTASA